MQAKRKPLLLLQEMQHFIEDFSLVADHGDVGADRRKFTLCRRTSSAGVRARALVLTLQALRSPSGVNLLPAGRRPYREVFLRRVCPLSAYGKPRQEFVSPVARSDRTEYVAAASTFGFLALK